MLVSGLQNEALLFKMTSASAGNIDYSHVHESLRECAQEILDKYRQNQEGSQKLAIKTRATEILLSELGKVPKDSGETREVISSALKRHEEALQNHEHLLSRKGNIYALIEQTKGLREMNGDARASLLRYHDLKDKLLGADTPLNAKQKALISALDNRKGLTLQVLVEIDGEPRIEEAARFTYVYDGKSFPLQGVVSNATAENLECCICRNIMNQPREICPENHLTCRECARQLTGQCPECRSNLLTRFKQNISIERLIGNLQVRCCNAGCRSVMGISEIKSHLDLCGEEEIECPGRCIDEGTGEVLRIPRKQLADHSKECSGHFKCDNCTERFPCNTETKYLKKFQTHMRENHGEDQKIFTRFITSMVDKALSQRELLQKTVIPQTGYADFQRPTPGCDRGSLYCFDGTNCVRTFDDSVYQSKANPRHFFVTVEDLFYNENASREHHVHMAKIRFDKCIENGEARDYEWIFLEVHFFIEGTPSEIDDGKKIWAVRFFTSNEYTKRLVGWNRLNSINVTGYTGKNQQVKYSYPVGIYSEACFALDPYEGNRYLFKIVI